MVLASKGKKESDRSKTGWPSILWKWRVSLGLSSVHCVHGCMVSFGKYPEVAPCVVLCCSHSKGEVRELAEPRVTWQEEFWLPATHPVCPLSPLSSSLVSFLLPPLPVGSWGWEEAKAFTKWTFRRVLRKMQGFAVWCHPAVSRRHVWCVGRPSVAPFCVTPFRTMPGPTWRPYHPGDTEETWTALSSVGHVCELVFAHIYNTRLF